LRTLGTSALSDEDEQEAASRRMVMTICGLAEPVPFVFCFDQLEALQYHRQDKEGFFKLGQVVSDLHDGTHNMALFSCLQTSMLPELDAIVIGADRDRMSRNRAGLNALTWEQASKLIDARLNTVGELSGHPINPGDLKDLFKDDGRCIARKVIVRCRELFDQWSNAPALPEEPLEAALDRKLRELQRTPRVDDAEAILRKGVPEMLYLRGIKLTAPQRPNTVLDGIVPGKKPAAIAICNQKPGQVLIRRLEKAQSDWQASGAPGLLILRDARNGVGAGAKKTRESIEKLEKAGARILPVTQEALAALEAITRLLANARSGDLTHRGDSIPVSTVETWLSGNMPRAVDEFFDEIGGDRSSAPDQLVGMLTDLLARVKVTAVEDAAQQLGKTVEEVEECGRRNASLMGFAGGSKRVLFRIVEGQQATEQRD
jgi:hypothetical protein